MTAPEPQRTPLGRAFVAPKVRRQTVAEQGLALLRRQILDGELKPGTAVTEEAMARYLGISRPTMREVLNTLLVEGLLTRHLGTRVLEVTTLSRDEIQEIYVARRLLELAGVDAAATVSDGEFQGLQDAVAEMALAVGTGDVVALVRADSRCHSETVAFLHSRYLTRAHTELMAKLHLTMSQVEGTDERDNSQLLRDHQEYCAMILARQTSKAKASLLARLNEAERLVLSRSSMPG